MLLARRYARVGRSWLPGQARSWPGAIAWLLLALLLVACGRQPAGNDAPAVPTQPAGPTSAPLAELAPTAPATATIPQPPAPTATIAFPATPTPSPASQQCDFIWFFAPEPDACPGGPPTISAAAEQPFEKGVMIWLEKSDAIIVFYDDGRWQRFEDTWSEGEPDRDPSITAPEGRFQPIRGFGKLWRQQPGVREALGWALGVELGFESIFQDEAPPPDQPRLTYLSTYNGQVFALISRASDQGDWVVAADNR